MNRLKKILITSVATLSIVAAPLTANSQSIQNSYSMTAYALSSTIGNATYTYELDGTNNTAFLTSISTSASSVTIPSTITENGKNYSVTGIEHSFLINNQTVTTLVIPNTVKTIGNGFASNSAIRTLTVSSNVEQIGDGFCENCKNLETINYTGTKLNIFGSSAFQSTKFIEKYNTKNAVVFGDWIIRYNPDPSNVVSNVKVSSLGTIPIRKIYDIAFDSCNQISSVNLSQITQIKKDAFYECSNLSTFTNASALKSVEENAFLGTPWYNTQIASGSVILENTLIKYSLPNGSTCIDLSGTKYQNIEYIASNILRFGIYNVKSIKLPKKLKAVMPDMLCSPNLIIESPLETVYFYNTNEQAYDNLETMIANNTLSVEEKDFLHSNYEAFKCTKFSERITLILGKRFLQSCGVEYYGSPDECNLSAWDQYEAARKIFIRIDETTNYKCDAGKSVNYKEELLNHKGIQCHDYAELYQYLLGLSGIRAEYITSIPEGEHAYNIIKIGSTWYNADSCWNDCARMFMSTDEAMKYHVWSDQTASPDNCHTRQASSLNLPACTTMMGDINGDGMIDGSDATMILSAYGKLNAGKTPNITSDQLVRCDVNRDGVVNGTDATHVLSYYSACMAGWKYTFENYIDYKGIHVFRG